MNFTGILLGILTLTAYQPIPSQTKASCHNKDNCYTSIGDVPTKFGVAVSQDLLSRNKGPIHYGDILYIENIGFRVVNDTMAKRHKKSIDILVWTKKEEYKIGLRHIHVWLVKGE